jgi:hypothetical protein
VRSSSLFGVHVNPFTVADVVSLLVSAVSVRPSVRLVLPEVSGSEVLVVVWLAVPLACGRRKPISAQSISQQRAH